MINQNKEVPNYAHSINSLEELGNDLTGRYQMPP